MDIGIGLPNTIPGTPGTRLVEWARRAEERGFSGLATIDRISYPSFESIVALSAAAAATERVSLLSNVLLGPTRNPVLLAKEAASLDQLSAGRFTLGVGVGNRPDDYRAAGQEFAGRGKRWDRDLELIHRAWQGERVNGAERPVGPAPTRGARVPILIGGMSDQAIERTIRWGIGWTVGGAPPEVGGPFADRVREAWRDADKEGEPRIVGLSYFALGEDPPAQATGYLSDYYGEYGPSIAERVPKDPAAVRDVVQRFEDFGFDELYLDPTSFDLREVDRAADAVGL